MATLKFLKYLKPSCIIPHMKAADKTEAIVELVDKLGSEGLLDDVERVRKDVLDREALMSTGLKDGLAVPHAKSEGTKDMAVALGLKQEGIEFQSLDGQPARIIFLVVSRVDRAGPHLQCLAEIAQFFSDVQARTRLVQAETEQEALAALSAF